MSVAKKIPVEQQWQGTIEELLDKGNEILHHAGIDNRIKRRGFRHYQDTHVVGKGQREGRASRFRRTDLLRALVAFMSSTNKTLAPSKLGPIIVHLNDDDLWQVFTQMVLDHKDGCPATTPDHDDINSLIQSFKDDGHNPDINGNNQTRILPAGLTKDGDASGSIADYVSAGTANSNNILRSTVIGATKYAAPNPSPEMTETITTSDVAGLTPLSGTPHGVAMGGSGASRTRKKEGPGGAKAPAAPKISNMIELKSGALRLTMPNDAGMDPDFSYHADSIISALTIMKGSK